MLRQEELTRGTLPWPNAIMQFDIFLSGPHQNDQIISFTLQSNTNIIPIFSKLLSYSKSKVRVRHIHR